MMVRTGPAFTQRRPWPNGRIRAVPPENWGLWLLGILLLINLFLLARAVDMVRFPGELTEVETTRQGGLVLVRHFEDEAKNQSLDQNPAVREVLAQFKFELEQGVTAEQVASVINSYGRRVQEVIAREQEGKLHERIRQLILQDVNFPQNERRAFLRIVPEGADGVQIEDPDGILSETTRTAIISDPAVRQLTQMVEIEVAEGKVSLLTPRTLPEELEAMRKDAAILRGTLQDLRRSTGYGPMTGAGLVIRMRGPSTGKTGVKVQDEEIIFGSEVRDLVNELLAAGAIGIEIGGERMIATTSIRNVGNQLLVNNRVVEIHPLVIKVVGDPTVLAKSLDLLVNTPYFEPTLEFAPQENLTLQAYLVSR